MGENSLRIEDLAMSEEQSFAVDVAASKPYTNAGEMTAECKPRNEGEVDVSNTKNCEMKVEGQSEYMPSRKGFVSAIFNIDTSAASLKSCSLNTILTSTPGSDGAPTATEGSVGLKSQENGREQQNKSLDGRGPTTLNLSGASTTQNAVLCKHPDAQEEGVSSSVSPWSDEEVQALVDGFRKHGSNWRTIHKDPVLSKRSLFSLKSKWGRMIKPKLDSRVLSNHLLSSGESGPSQLPFEQVVESGGPLDFPFNNVDIPSRHSFPVVAPVTSTRLEVNKSLKGTSIDDSSMVSKDQQISRASNGVSSVVWRALDLYEIGNTEEAYQLICSCLSKSEQSCLEAHLFRALLTMLQTEANLESALMDCNFAITIAPRSSAVRLSRALVRLCMNEPENALADLRFLDPEYMPDVIRRASRCCTALALCLMGNTFHAMQVINGELCSTRAASDDNSSPIVCLVRNQMSNFLDRISEVEKELTISSVVDSHNTEENPSKNGETNRNPVDFKKTWASLTERTSNEHKNRLQARAASGSVHQADRSSSPLDMLFGDVLERMCQYKDIEEKPKPIHIETLDSSTFKNTDTSEVPQFDEVVVVEHELASDANVAVLKKDIWFETAEEIEKVSLEWKTAFDCSGLTPSATRSRGRVNSLAPFLRWPSSRYSLKNSGTAKRGSNRKEEPFPYGLFYWEDHNIICQEELKILERIVGPGEALSGMKRSHDMLLQGRANYIFPSSSRSLPLSQQRSRKLQCRSLFHTIP